MNKITSENDIKIIAALAREIYTEHYTPIIGIKQVNYMLDKFQNEKAIKEQIENGTIYNIIYKDETPCGYFAVDINEPKGKVFLSKLYIKKAARGSGLARKALSIIKDMAKENGLSAVWLHVNKHNPSIEAYKSLGFIITEAVKNSIGGGFYMDDYIMELALNNEPI